MKMLTNPPSGQHCAAFPIAAQMLKASPARTGSGNGELQLVRTPASAKSADMDA
ncbi:hypothetical protein EBBID32_19740 [Sphingobium indicum BiD32]|uniref:Uncharacterized protein n=1 Tax=Sphingobium indicum BiD32 TaxID=1301087 RepID=N1MQD6_9SPHN|nr:hypothetical protein EBBID32_19740 [Sphingobium indicum BiD32]